MIFREVYRVGVQCKGGWCCRFCHRVQFQPDRCGFARLLVHRAIRHGRFTFKGFDPQRGCWVQHNHHALTVGTPGQLVVPLFYFTTTSPTPQTWTFTRDGAS